MNIKAQARLTTIPQQFARRIEQLHSTTGVEWLRRLPGLLTECAARWALTIEAPFTPLTYNFVAPAVCADGTPVVLKVGVPCRELSTEIAALRCFDGRDAVRLLDADGGQGVLLLERLTPETSLLSVAKDEQATHIAAAVMRGLRRSLPGEHLFPSVTEWVCGLKSLRRRFGGGTGPLPPRLVEAAEGLSRDLLASAPETILLHGDLHHGNILTSERALWLAIDPKGVAGEPAFEPSAFLLNPGPRSASILTRRVAVFAEALCVPEERVRGWGFVRAVLSAWWSLEDHEDGWDAAIATAEALRPGSGS